MAASELGPWAVCRYACETRRFATLAQAKAFADRHYRLGIVDVVHETSGEEWRRKLFTWTQTRDASPGHDPEPAA